VIWPTLLLFFCFVLCASW
ncbi:hypothetical protein EE612_027787, partial [Oryza sativa]